MFTLRKVMTVSMRIYYARPLNPLTYWIVTEEVRQRHVSALLEECLTLVASSANLPVVYNAHEVGQVKGYPQTPDIYPRSPCARNLDIYTYWRAKRAYLVVRMARFFYIYDIYIYI